MTADEIIARLGLKPHPEGGHFVETFRAPEGTAIYFLLKAGERSHWHRVDAVEVWHWYSGAALKLQINSGNGTTDVELGADLALGQRPQTVVPAHAWQAAESLGDWTLVGCTVAPGFQFEGFELAPLGWTP